MHFYIWSFRANLQILINWISHWAGKWLFFWVGHFDFFLRFFFASSQWKEAARSYHMRYHLFRQYGWFLQNLGKDFIPTNMHTNVFFFLFFYFWISKKNMIWSKPLLVFTRNKKHSSIIGRIISVILTSSLAFKFV